MQLHQIIIIYSIYALFGVVGVCMDLTNPTEQEAIKSMAWYKLTALLLAYIFLLGPICFYPAYIDYRERQRAKKRQAEVLEILNGITGHYFNCMIEPDRKFILSLNAASNRGILNDSEYQRLIDLCIGYSGVNILNVK